MPFTSTSLSMHCSKCWCVMLAIYTLILPFYLILVEHSTSNDCYRWRFNGVHNFWFSINQNNLEKVMWTQFGRCFMVRKLMTCKMYSYIFSLTLKQHLDNQWLLIKIVLGVVNALTKCSIFVRWGVDNPSPFEYDSNVIKKIED